MSRMDHMGEDFDKEEDEIGHFDLMGIWFNFTLGWLIGSWTFWIVLLVLGFTSCMLIGRRG